jgi:hypothetical protein
LCSRSRRLSSRLWSRSSSATTKNVAQIGSIHVRAGETTRSSSRLRSSVKIDATSRRCYIHCGCCGLRCGGSRSDYTGLRCCSWAGRSSSEDTAGSRCSVATCRLSVRIQSLSDTL